MKNRKKLVALVMVLALALASMIGGTLAYFTDDEAAVNTFTMGNVKIDLIEDFEEDEAELIPGKDIKKAVTVKNVGHNEAYVRVHIAIPAIVDDGDPSFAAVNNFLHFNFDWDSVKDGQWTWFKTDKPAEIKYADYPGYPATGNPEWNFYKENINSVDYNVYVVTYETALKSGETTTTAAINNVYLDASVDNEFVTDDEGNVTSIIYTDTHENKIVLDTEDVTAAIPDAFKILVVAEAAQKEGFTSAIEALNTAFGVPGEEGYHVNWPQVTVPEQ